MSEHLVQTESDASKLCEKLSCHDTIGFDTESSGPLLVKKGSKDDRRMVNIRRSSLTGFSVAFEDGTSYYVPTGHTDGNCSPCDRDKLLTAVLSSEEVWVHNWKHERLVLQIAGKSYMVGSGMLCSQVACWLANVASNKGKYNLKDLSESVLKTPMASFKDTVGDRQQFMCVPPEEGVGYAAGDAAATLRLGLSVKVILKRRHMWDYFLGEEMMFVNVLGGMEDSGMPLDAEATRALAVAMGAKADEATARWSTLLPEVSIASPSQIRDAMYGSEWSTEGIGRTKEKNEPQVTTEALEVHAARCAEGSLGKDVAETKLLYQASHKILSTYAQPLIDQARQHEDGRLHPSFHHTGTVTGRLSCSSPNLQNIPARGGVGTSMKRCFSAEEGNLLVCADYSQLELRVLAHFVGGALLSACERGDDLHALAGGAAYRVLLADVTESQRDVGKTLNFLVIYGGGPKKVMKKIGSTLEEAKKIVENYGKAYPEIRDMRDSVVAAVGKRGYVKTLSRRRRYINLPSGNGPLRWAAERKAFNTVIQGGASDIVKTAMLLYSRMHGVGEMICQVHDEIILEVPAELAHRRAVDLEECMSEAGEVFDLNVELIADPSVGKTWADVK